MTDLASRRAEMRALVVDAHGAQRRNGGRVPYAVHVLSVGTIVEDALDLGGECSDPGLRHDLYLAAIGHDLYKDTPVERDRIRAKFGERVDAWIAGTTSRTGEPADAVRLVRLADLIDNATSCAYSIHDLTHAWVATTFLPSVTDLFERDARPGCVRFPRTEAILIGWADYAMHRLRAMLDVTSAIDYLDAVHGN